MQCNAVINVNQSRYDRETGVLWEDGRARPPIHTSASETSSKGSRYCRPSCTEPGLDTRNELENGSDAL